MAEIRNDAPAGRFPGGINERASVVGASEIEIAAPPETVWEVLTAFDRWPSWNPDVKSMSVQGRLVEGSVFSLEGGARDDHLDDWARRAAAADRLERHDARHQGNPFLVARAARREDLRADEGVVRGARYSPLPAVDPESP